MRPRSELRAILQEICANLYFQPPETVKMKYPCIVYSLSKIDSRYASDMPYTLHNRYELTYICKNPDDSTKYAIAQLQGCRFDRTFVADNLYHYVFTIYF